MLDIHINGRKVETLLDTGSPISIMPSKLTRWLQPITRLDLPTGKKFVDINQNPIKMSGRFKTTAKLGESYGETTWWEVDGIEIPILGMDNFKRLNLSVQQKKPTQKKGKTSKTKNIKKWEKIYFVEKEIEDPQTY